MMTNIWEVAKITIREMLSRKHYYALIVLLILLFVGLSRLQFFQLGEETKFIRIVPMLGLPLFGILITIFAAARQIPVERENRTLYPMLAKPIRRWQFIVGKYLGVEIMVTVSLLLIALVCWLNMTGREIVSDILYWQATLGFILQLSVFCAIVLLLSTMMSHAATVTTSFLVYYLLCATGPSLEDTLWREQLSSGMMYTLYKVILYIIPRFDLLDISWAVRHDITPQGWHVMIPLVLYALLYTVCALIIASVIFRKKEL